MSFVPSPQKRYNANKFVVPGGNTSAGAESGPSKFTYSQRKSVEKEEEEYAKMFQLFDTKAEIKYLDSHEEDKLAACVYGDAKINTKKKGKTSKGQPKPNTSGYDFGEMLKNEKVMDLNESWRKY
jgi:hypothetical protein